MEDMRTISALVTNERGVLARVASLFARRGFNITSLAVGETENQSISRISVVFKGDASTGEQMVKQMERLVCVQKVEDLSPCERVESGLLLVKVRSNSRTRAELVELAGIFRGRVAHVDGECVVIEATGRREKLAALIDMLRPHGIIELARTGQIMLDRNGSLSLEPIEESIPKELRDGDDGAVYNLTRASS